MGENGREGEGREDKAVCGHHVFGESADFLFVRTSLPFLDSRPHSGNYYYCCCLPNIWSAYSYRHCAQRFVYTELYKVLHQSIFLRIRAGYQELLLSQ